MIPPRRHTRPGSLYGSGLPLDGLKKTFGIAAIIILALVGIGVLLMQDSMRMDKLAPVEVELQASPYHTARGGDKGMLLLPVTGARVLSLNRNAWHAADTNLLSSLNKGDMLVAWLLNEDAAIWNQGRSKAFPEIVLLQNASKDWIISLENYNKLAGRESAPGWWLIGLSLLLLPYLLIPRPKVPAYVALLLYASLLALWLIWG